jgi:hypothetical protein
MTSERAEIQHFLIFTLTKRIGWSGFSTLKAIPLQAWTDPEGSRRLRFPDFKTIGT